jgi:LPXTG-motif cell wall-anchored protein
VDVLLAQITPIAPREPSTGYATAGSLALLLALALAAVGIWCWRRRHRGGSVGAKDVQMEQLVPGGSAASESDDTM